MELAAGGALAAAGVPGTASVSDDFALVVLPDASFAVNVTDGRAEQEHARRIRGDGRRRIDEIDGPCAAEEARRCWCSSPEPERRR